MREGKRWPQCFDPEFLRRLSTINKRKEYGKKMLNFGYLEFEWPV